MLVFLLNLIGTSEILRKRVVFLFTHHFDLVIFGNDQVKMVEIIKIL